VTSIKFGTSGWRGLIARDFTFENVRFAAQGIADYLLEEIKLAGDTGSSQKREVIIGHDTRFLGREFSLAVAEVLAANGLVPVLCQRDAPTPVIAHAIRVRKALGGINMTASHNPAEYQGLKFSGSNGAAAPPEVTGRIETHIRHRQESGWTFQAGLVGSFRCKEIDPAPAYLKQLRKHINFAVIKKAKLKIAVELMYGTGRGYLDTLLEEDGGAKVLRFHDTLNPSFGGHHPEPNAEGMAPAREAILAGKATLGLGLDGDADRFGIVDRDGT
jgi:phosphomannomutase